MKTLRIAIFLALGLIVLPLIFSQNTQPVDPLKEQVDGLFAEKKYAEVITFVIPWYQKTRSDNNWPMFGIYADYLAKSYYFDTMHTEALDIAQASIKALEQSGQGNSIIMANLLVWEALEFNKLEQFGKSLESYEKAINIYESNRFIGPKLAYAYKNAAQVYQRYSNDRKALTYFEAALVSDTTVAASQNVSAYANLASMFLDLDSLDLAKKYYNQGRAQNNSVTSYQASLDFSGAILALKTGKLDSARLHIQNALHYYESDPGEGPNRIRALTTLADIATRQHLFRQAEQYFHQAETAGKLYYNGKSREMAKLYNETGLFYEQHNQPDRALTYFQKALVQAFPNFNSLEITDNPGLSEALLESQAMRAAAAKAQLLLKLSNTSKNAAALRRNAAHCFNLSFAVATRLRHTYGNDVDKIALSANNRIAYQAAALNLWQLWNDTPETTYLEQLFSLIEQTKAQSLADALQQQKALVLSGIPDSLLQKEAVLRLESAVATNESEMLEAGKDSTEASKKLRAFRQKKTYDDFIGQLGKEYPQFRQYAEADVSADVSAIRKALPDSTVLLSWFDAGDRYLCLRLHGSEIWASEVMRDSVFDHSLLDFIALLSDLNRQQASPGDFFQAAHALHQKLFPIDPLAGVKSLLIVPDGLLCYLPFEVLLTAPHDKGGFATAPYMFRQCAVTYSWSAKLLAVSMTPAAQLGFVQFAPFASSARDHLAVLDNSLADVPQTMSSSVLEGAEASTATFRAEAPENNVIHLSTHAQVGKNGVPGIEFFDRTMTLPEIYAQRFQASLVTLSACETGAGKFAGGEGVLSLARAFAYAGAQSMVASLWSVNDRATAALFSAFYQNLQQGNSKSEALRQAKLACLSAEESDARKAPYYWAAFTLSGADGSVNMSNPWSVLWQWGLAILMLSMAIFWGFRKRRKSQTSA